MPQVALTGKRIVSASWIDEVTSWGPKDQQVKLGGGGTAPEGLVVEALSEVQVLHVASQSGREPAGASFFSQLRAVARARFWPTQLEGLSDLGLICQIRADVQRRVIVHMETGTVLVQTAVTDEQGWLPELQAMVEAAALL